MDEKSEYPDGLPYELDARLRFDREPSSIIPHREWLEDRLIDWSLFGVNALLVGITPAFGVTERKIQCFFNGLNLAVYLTNRWIHEKHFSDNKEYSLWPILGGMTNLGLNIYVPTSVGVQIGLKILAEISRPIIQAVEQGQVDLIRPSILEGIDRDPTGHQLINFYEEMERVALLDCYGFAKAVQILDDPGAALEEVIKYVFRPNDMAQNNVQLRDALFDTLIIGDQSGQLRQFFPYEARGIDLFQQRPDSRGQQAFDLIQPRQAETAASLPNAAHSFGLPEFDWNKKIMVGVTLDGIPFQPNSDLPTSLVVPSSFAISTAAHYNAAMQNSIKFNRELQSNIAAVIASFNPHVNIQWDNVSNAGGISLCVLVKVPSQYVPVLGVVALIGICANEYYNYYKQQKLSKKIKKIQKYTDKLEQKIEGLISAVRQVEKELTEIAAIQDNVARKQAYLNFFEQNAIRKIHSLIYYLKITEQANWKHVHGTSHGYKNQAREYRQQIYNFLDGCQLKIMAEDPSKMDREKVIEKQKVLIFPAYNGSYFIGFCNRRGDYETFLLNKHDHAAIIEQIATKNFAADFNDQVNHLLASLHGTLLSNGLVRDFKKLEQSIRIEIGTHEELQQMLNNPNYSQHRVQILEAIADCQFRAAYEATLEKKYEEAIALSKQLPESETRQTFQATVRRYQISESSEQELLKLLEMPDYLEFKPEIMARLDIITQQKIIDLIETHKDFAQAYPLCEHIQDEALKQESLFFTVYAQYLSADSTESMEAVVGNLKAFVDRYEGEQDAITILGWAYIQQGKYQEAETLVKTKMLHQDPDNLYGLTILSCSQFYQGQLLAAKETNEQIVQLLDASSEKIAMPQNFFLLYIECMIRTDSLDEGLKKLVNLCEKHPAETSLLYATAKGFFANNDFEQAQRYVGLSIEKDNTNLDAHCLKAYIAIAQTEIIAATTYSEQIKGLFGDDIRITQLEVSLAYVKKEYNSVIKLVAEAAEKNQSMPGCYAMLTDSIIQTKNIQQGLDLFTTLHHLDPKSAAILLETACLHQVKGDLRTALTLVNQSLTLENSVRGLCIKAQCEFGLYDFKAAELTYKNALTLHEQGSQKHQSPDMQKDSEPSQALDDNLAVVQQTGDLQNRINYHRQNEYLWLTNVSRYVFNHLIQPILKSDSLPDPLLKVLKTADVVVPLLFDFAGNYFHNQTEHLSKLLNLGVEDPQERAKLFEAMTKDSSIASGLTWTLGLEVFRKAFGAFNDYCVTIPGHDGAQHLSGNLLAVFYLYRSMENLYRSAMDTGIFVAATAFFSPCRFLNFGMSLLNLSLSLTETVCFAYESFNSSYSIRFCTNLTAEDINGVLRNKDIVLIKLDDSYQICFQGKNGKVETQSLDTVLHAKLIKEIKDRAFDGSTHKIHEQYVEPLLRFHNPTLIRIKISNGFFSRMRIASSFVRQNPVFHEANNWHLPLTILNNHSAIATFFARFDAIRKAALFLADSITTASERFSSLPVLQFIGQKLGLANLLALKANYRMGQSFLDLIDSCKAAPELQQVGNLCRQGNLSDALTALDELIKNHPAMYRRHQSVLKRQKTDLLFSIAIQNQNYGEAQIHLDEIKKLAHSNPEDVLHTTRRQHELLFEQKKHQYQEALNNSNFNRARTLLTEIASNPLINDKIRFLKKSPSAEQKQAVICGEELIFIKQVEKNKTTYYLGLCGKKNNYLEKLLDSKKDADLISQLDPFNFDGKHRSGSIELWQKINPTLQRLEAKGLLFSIDHKKSFDPQKHAVKTRILESCKKANFADAKKDLTKLRALGFNNPVEQQECNRLESYQDYLSIQKDLDELLKTGKYTLARANAEALQNHPLTQCYLYVTRSNPNLKLHKEWLQNNLFFLIQRDALYFLGFKNMHGLYAEKQISQEEGVQLSGMDQGSLKDSFLQGDFLMMHRLNKLVEEANGMQPFFMPDLTVNAEIYHKITCFHLSCSNKETLAEAKGHLEGLSKLFQRMDDLAAEHPRDNAQSGRHQELLAEYGHRLSYAEGFKRLDELLDVAEMKAEQPAAGFQRNQQIVETVDELVANPLTPQELRSSYLEKVQLQAKLRTEHPALDSIFDEIHTKMQNKRSLRLLSQEETPQPIRMADDEIVLLKTLTGNYQLLFHAQGQQNTLDIDPQAEPSLHEKLKTLSFNNVLYTGSNQKVEEFELMQHTLCRLTKGDYLLSTRDILLFQEAHSALFSKAAKYFAENDSYQKEVAVYLGSFVPSADDNKHRITDQQALMTILSDDPVFENLSAKDKIFCDLVQKFTVANPQDILFASLHLENLVRQGQFSQASAFQDLTFKTLMQSKTKAIATIKSLHRMMYREKVFLELQKNNPTFYELIGKLSDTNPDVALYLGNLVHQQRFPEAEAFANMQHTHDFLKSKGLQNQQLGIDFVTRFLMLASREMATRQMISQDNSEAIYTATNLLQDTAVPVYEYLLGRQFAWNGATAGTALQLISSLFDFSACLSQFIGAEPQVYNYLSIGARTTYLSSCYFSLPNYAEYLNYGVPQKFITGINTMTFSANSLAFLLSGIEYSLGTQHSAFHFNKVGYHLFKASVQGIGRSRALFYVNCYQILLHPFFLEKLGARKFYASLAKISQNAIMGIGSTAAAQKFLTKTGLNRLLKPISSAGLAKLGLYVSYAAWGFVIYDVYSISKTMYQDNRFKGAVEQIEQAFQEKNMSLYQEALTLMAYYKNESPDFLFCYDYFRFHEDLLRGTISATNLSKMEDYLKSPDISILSTTQIQQLQLLLSRYQISFGLENTDVQRYLDGLSYLKAHRNDSTASRFAYVFHLFQKELMFGKVTKKTLRSMEHCVEWDVSEDQRQNAYQLLARYKISLAMETKNERKYAAALYLLERYKDNSLETHFSYLFHLFQKEIIFSVPAETTIRHMMYYLYSNELKNLSLDHQHSMLILTFNAVANFPEPRNRYVHAQSIKQYITQNLEKTRAGELHYLSAQLDLSFLDNLNSARRSLEHAFMEQIGSKQGYKICPPLTPPMQAETGHFYLRIAHDKIEFEVIDSNQHLNKGMISFKEMPVLSQIQTIEDIEHLMPPIFKRASENTILDAKYLAADSVLQFYENRRQMLFVELGTLAMRSFIQNFFEKEPQTHQIKNKMVRTLSHIMSISSELYFIHSIRNQSMLDANIQLYSNQLSETEWLSKQHLETFLVIRLLSAMLETLDDWNTVAVNSEHPHRADQYYKSIRLNKYVINVMQMAFDAFYFYFCCNSLYSDFKRNTSEFTLSEGIGKTLFSSSMYYFIYSTLLRVVPRVMQAIHNCRPPQMTTYGISLYHATMFHLQNNIMRAVSRFFEFNNLYQRYTDAPLLLSAGQQVHNARVNFANLIPSAETINLMTLLSRIAVVSYSIWLIRSICRDAAMSYQRKSSLENALEQGRLQMSQQNFPEVLASLKTVDQASITEYDEQAQYEYLRAAAQFYQNPDACAQEVLNSMVNLIKDYRHTPYNHGLYETCVELKKHATEQLQSNNDEMKLERPSRSVVSSAGAPNGFFAQPRSLPEKPEEKNNRCQRLTNHCVIL